MRHHEPGRRGRRTRDGEVLQPAPQAAPHAHATPVEARRPGVTLAGEG